MYEKCLIAASVGAILLAQAGWAVAGSQEGGGPEGQPTPPVAASEAHRAPGSSLMSPQEQAMHRRKMRDMSMQEREAYRDEQYAKLRERAEEQGMALPETPPWKDPSRERRPGMTEAEHKEFFETLRSLDPDERRAYLAEQHEKMISELESSSPPMPAPRAMPERPGMAEPPVMPKHPGMPQPPVMPKHPGMPQPPAMPKHPGMTEPPAMPKHPGMTEPPAMPERPAMPQPPAMPERPAMPQPPAMPKHPGMTEPPAMPKRPAVPQPPTMPKRPAIPEPPAMPEARPMREVPMAPGYGPIGADEWASLHRRLMQMTPEERDAYRMEHYARLREVAKAAGIELPESPPWSVSPEQWARQRGEQMDRDWEAYRGRRAEPSMYWYPVPRGPWGAPYEGGDVWGAPQPTGDYWDLPAELPPRGYGPAPYSGAGNQDVPAQDSESWSRYPR